MSKNEIEAEIKNLQERIKISKQNIEDCQISIKKLNNVITYDEQVLKLRKEQLNLVKE